MYFLLQNPTTAQLAAEVRLYLAEGYIPYGHPFFANGYFCQAVYHPGEGAA